MKRLNIAIVGCGWVADWHVNDGLAHLPALFSLTTCCDSDEKRMKEFADRYAIPNQIRSYNELLKRPDIDVVTICTPPGLHFEMVKAALEAGKHVICEKPFTSSLELVDAAMQLEKKSTARVMPIFQYRFGDGIAKVRHVIQSGLAGKHYVTSIDTAKTRGPDYYTVAWRGKFTTELGGVLVTQAIHIHDLAFWLLGPAVAVSAFKTTRVNPIEVEDCAVASVLMADGSLMSLSATLGSARQVARMRFCFENVTFEKIGYDNDSSRPGEDPWVIIPKTPKIGEAIEAKMKELKPQKSWFARQYELFHEAVTTGGPLPVTLADARASLELITACYHASETQSVVHLPIESEHPRYRGWAPASSDEQRQKVLASLPQVTDLHQK
jgi:predicted dehydrogenase